MAETLPVDFEQKVKQPPAANGTGYPYRISANDLMKDFVFASPIIEATTPSGKKNGITSTPATGQGGHKARKLSCTYVPEASTKGAFLAWDGDKWDAISPPSQNGTIVFWNGSAWAALPPPSGESPFVLSCLGGTLSWLETEGCSSNA